MATRALIFDYGNVLDYIDDPAPWLARRESVAAQFNMDAKQFWTLLYDTEPWQLAKRGKITPEEYWNRILRPLGVTDQAGQSAFVERLFEGRAVIHPDMKTLLYALKPHYQLAVLSNTDLVEMETWFVTAHGLVNLFDVVVSSAQVGLAKPDAEIYRLTLDRLNLAPEEVLFIDDLPRNTEAALALGLPSIVFESPAQLRRELQARQILPVQER